MRHLACLLAIVLASLLPRLASAEEPGFRVVVNPANPLAEISRAKLADLLLRKSGSWDSGAPCKPVDQPPDSAVRKAFSSEVMRRSVAAVIAYWQQRVFSGRGAPPPEMSSDEEVAAYVRANENAVGYVSPKANLSGLKILKILP